MAFGGSLTLAQAFWLTPVVLLVAMIPISTGGIGLAEWAYLFALVKFGVPETAALSAALLIRLKAVLIGALGGLLFGFDWKRHVEPEAGDADAEPSAPSAPAGGEPSVEGRWRV
jgi:uncharacterized membrane protein YbhN (UPF0104 family)